MVATQTEPTMATNDFTKILAMRQSLKYVLKLVGRPRVARVLGCVLASGLTSCVAYKILPYLLGFKSLREIGWWLGPSGLASMISSRVDTYSCDINKAGGHRLVKALNVPMCAPVPARLRLRRHSRWVRALQMKLGGLEGSVGKLFKGIWVPDQPNESRTAETNFLLGFVKGGVKILGGGIVQSTGGENDVETDWPQAAGNLYLVVEFSDGSEGLVFPSLIARLAQYSLLRQRTYDLALSVRSRARDWLKARSIPESYAYWATLTAIRLSLVGGVGEDALARQLREVGVCVPPLSSAPQ